MLMADSDPSVCNLSSLYPVPYNSPSPAVSVRNAYVERETRGAENGAKSES